MRRLLWSIARLWFAPTRLMDRLRASEWNTGPIRAFRVAVARQIADDGMDQKLDFLVYANRLKWHRKWRGMYLRAQWLTFAWYAVLALELAPLVAAPVAMIWWLSQHLTVTVGWQ